MRKRNSGGIEYAKSIPLDGEELVNFRISNSIKRKRRKGESNTLPPALETFILDSLTEKSLTDEELEHIGLSLISFCQMGYIPSCDVWLRWIDLVGSEPVVSSMPATTATTKSTTTAVTSTTSADVAASGAGNLEHMMVQCSVCKEWVNDFVVKEDVEQDDNWACEACQQKAQPATLNAARAFVVKPLPGQLSTKKGAATDPTPVLMGGSVFGDGVQNTAARVLVDSVTTLRAALEQKTTSGEKLETDSSTTITTTTTTDNDDENSSSSSSSSPAEYSGIPVGILAVHEGDSHQYEAMKPLRLKVYSLLNAVVEAYGNRDAVQDGEDDDQEEEQQQQQQQSVSSSSRSRSSAKSVDAVHEEGRARAQRLTETFSLSSNVGSGKKRGRSKSVDGFDEKLDKDLEQLMLKKLRNRESALVRVSLGSAAQLLRCFASIFSNEQSPSKSLQFLLNCAEDGSDFEVSRGHRTTRQADVIKGRAFDYIKRLCGSFNQNYMLLAQPSFPMENVQQLVDACFGVVEVYLDQNFQEKVHLMSELRTVLQRFDDMRSLFSFLSTLKSKRFREMIVHYLCCDLSHTRAQNADHNVRSLGVVLKGVVNTQYLMSKRDAQLHRYVMLVFIRMQQLVERFGQGTLLEQGPATASSKHRPGFTDAERDRYRKNIIQFWTGLRAHFFAGDSDDAKLSVFRVDVIKTESLRLLDQIPVKTAGVPTAEAAADEPTTTSAAPATVVKKKKIIKRKKT